MHIQYISNPSLICSTNVNIPCASGTKGNGCHTTWKWACLVFLKHFPSIFFYPLSLVSSCTTVSAEMSLLMYCCLIYKLILLSSESENGKMGTRHRSALWNTLETSIYSNTRCSDNDSLLLPAATPHYSCLFFFPIWLFTCRFVSSLLPNLHFTWGLLNFYGFIVQLALYAWW